MIIIITTTTHTSTIIIINHGLEVGLSRGGLAVVELTLGEESLDGIDDDDDDDDALVASVVVK